MFRKRHCRPTFFRFRCKFDSFLFFQTIFYSNQHFFFLIRRWICENWQFWITIYTVIYIEIIIWLYSWLIRIIFVWIFKRTIWCSYAWIILIRIFLFIILSIYLISHKSSIFVTCSLYCIWICIGWLFIKWIWKISI